MQPQPHTHAYTRIQLLDRAVLAKRLGSFLLRCGNTGDTAIGTQPQGRASSSRTPSTPWCRCIPAYCPCMYVYSVHCCACGRCGRVLHLSQPRVCGPRGVPLVQPLLLLQLFPVRTRVVQTTGMKTLRRHAARNQAAWNLLCIIYGTHVGLACGASATDWLCKQHA